MSHLKTLLVAPIIALLLIAVPHARAGNINWTYNWQPGALALYGDAGTTGGYVAFTNQPSGAATGSSDVVASNLRTVSQAAPGTPDSFNAAGDYSLTMQITDLPSGQTGTLTFTGKLGNTFSDSNANVSNQFTGNLTQQLFLGNDTYTVTIGPYTPPGPPNATNAGSISAHVDVSSIGITSEAPEPTSIALSLFGLTTLGAGWWRKRRAAAV